MFPSISKSFSSKNSKLSHFVNVPDPICHYPVRREAHSDSLVFDLINTSNFDPFAKPSTSTTDLLSRFSHDSSHQMICYNKRNNVSTSIKDKHNITDRRVLTSGNRSKTPTCNPKLIPKKPRYIPEVNPWLCSFCSLTIVKRKQSSLASDCNTTPKKKSKIDSVGTPFPPRLVPYFDKHADFVTHFPSKSTRNRKTMALVPPITASTLGCPTLSFDDLVAIVCSPTSTKTWPDVVPISPSTASYVDCSDE